MRTALTISLLCLGLSWASGQTTTAAAGGHYKAPSGATLSWTIGETITETARIETTTVTQGFHQTLLDIDTEVLDPALQGQIQLYPNPANAFLYLDTPADKDLRFRMININGVEMQAGTIQEQQTRLDIHHLPSGTYFLQLFAAEQYVFYSKIIITK